MPCRRRRGVGGRPRARGGGPAASPSSHAGEPSSPRSRGWSLVIDGLPDGALVVPALAGVVPARARHNIAIASRPRARGGGPVGKLAHCKVLGSSPRSRGWSQGVEHVDDGGGVVPALAGVVPAIAAADRSGVGRPRARGGGPSPFWARASSRASSPRSRGWSPAIAGWRGGDPVVPALAGVVPPSGSGRCSRTRRPRARGGGPLAAEVCGGVRGSSPRSRGWSLRARRGPLVPDVVPALAGVVPSASAAPTWTWRRPRARGGGPFRTGRCFSVGRSSPRSRGWSLRRVRGRAVPVVVPALAGVVPVCCTVEMVRQGRPRARGGGPGAR